MDIGDTRLIIVVPVGRCVATLVTPGTAERDVNILNALQSGFGHTDLGVFARVIRGRTIRPDQTVTLVET